MIQKISIFLFIISSFVSVYAQSAEAGKIFNKYSDAENGVNLFSGTAALNRNLVTVSAGNVSASVELIYSGNINEVVANRNDIAPTSWVGLGWSLGHAKIICEDAGTMWLGDDSYYFVTASGVRYSLFKEGVDESGEDKWWIESLPYWRVAPIKDNVNFGKNNYDIIVGWKVVDELGNTYFYGDKVYTSVYRNATEYTLANPYSTGIVGVVDNGKDVLFPNVWNLRRSEDIEGNYIEYEYEQFFEKVRIRKYQNARLIGGSDNLTRNSYTKESYLKKISSSEGVYVTFETQKKDYKDEYIDRKGFVETDDSNPDAFIDPLQRRYLSHITVAKNYINEKGQKVIKTLKNIDFCYKALIPKFNATKKSSGNISSENNSQYVKRLLTSVIESANEGEIQKEIYTYYENDFDEITKLPQNIGALHTVKSNGCGVVEYVYEQQTIEEMGSDQMRHTYLPIIHSSMGTMKDGTTYLLGINTREKNVQVYHRIADKWVLMQNLNGTESGDIETAQYSAEGTFVAGDENWFVYIEKNKDKTIYWPYQ